MELLHYIIKLIIIHLKLITINYYNILLRINDSLLFYSWINLLFFKRYFKFIKKLYAIFKNFDKDLQ